MHQASFTGKTSLAERAHPNDAAGLTLAGWTRKSARALAYAVNQVTSRLRHRVGQ